MKDVIESQKPLGVIIISILYVLAGCCWLWIFISSFDETSFFLIKAYRAVFGLFLVVLGYNLLNLKRWARYGVFALIGYIYANKFLDIGYYYIKYKRIIFPFSLFFNIFSIVMSGIVIYYLTRPKVKELFK